MKTHLNTLFVTTDWAYLAKKGQSLCVRIDKKIAFRVPLHNLDGVVCFGRIGASPALLGAAAAEGLTVSFLSDRGRFRYAAVGFSHGNVLLRREQYRVADDPRRAAELARGVVLGKLANGRTALMKSARDTHDSEAKSRISSAADRLSALIVEVKRAGQSETAPALDRIRGLEGEAASAYFGVFNDLVGSNDDTFRFTARSRRPPLDPVNALLSFAYTLLTHDVCSACEASGLDAAVGSLHRDRPGRPGLALDLMEEFRPVLADRLVLTLINRGQVTARSFETTASGAVHLTEAARKTVLMHWQKRKQEVVTHPYLDEKMTWGLVPHIQARLLARHLRGDINAYPPYIWK